MAIDQLSCLTIMNMSTKYSFIVNSMCFKVTSFYTAIILGIGGQPASKKPLVYINEQSRCGHWTDQSLKAFREEPTYMYTFQTTLIGLIPYYRRYRYSIHHRLIFT